METKSSKLQNNVTNNLQNIKENPLKMSNEIAMPKRAVSGIVLMHHDQLQQLKEQKNKEQKPRKKRLESMSDEEIIEENLKDLLEKKKDDQKANGRRIACIVAILLIFMAIYHAWIRKSAMLAGALVPAFIMIFYGGWVIILAKRDKEKRALFEKHIEEVTQKNKEELLKKAKLKKRKEKLSKQEKANMLNIVNELRPQPQVKRPSFRQKFFRQHAPSTTPTSLTTVANIHQLATTSLFSPALAFGTGVDIKPHVNLPPKLALPLPLPTPQPALLLLTNTTPPTTTTTSTNLQKTSNQIEIQEKHKLPMTTVQPKKQLQRTDALPVPHMGRMESSP